MRAMKTESEQDRRETVEVVKRNWRAEVETAQVYRELAARETDEKRKGILNRMAEAEERHAQRWAKKLADLGEPIPTLPDSPPKPAPPLACHQSIVMGHCAYGAYDQSSLEAFFLRRAMMTTTHTKARTPATIRTVLELPPASGAA